MQFLQVKDPATPGAEHPDEEVSSLQETLSG